MEAESWKGQSGWLQSLDVGEAAVFGSGLTVYPVRSRGAVEPRRYLTLEEALAQGLARVVESGNVPVLTVEVKGGTDVLVCLGTLLAGGLQNRVAESTVLLGEGVHKIPVRCVERGRWGWRGPDEAFWAWPLRADVDLRALMVRQRRMGTALSSEGGQLEVWQAVERRLRGAGAWSETSDLLAAYGRGEGQEEAGEAAAWPPDQVGVLVFGGGGGWWLDVFDHPDSWQAVGQAVLRSYGWVAALAPRGPGKVPASREEAVGFLSRVGYALEEGSTAPAPAGRGQHVFLASRGVEGVALLDGGRVVHVFARGW